MGFWDQSPGPHWSDYFWSPFSCSGIPFAIPIRSKKSAMPFSKHFGSISLAGPEQTSEVVLFLQTHFKITEKSVCTLSSETLLQGIQNCGWICVIARNGFGAIVGTIISRSVGRLQFTLKHKQSIRTSSASNVGYIDFFCIAPEMRKSGLGSYLLKWLDFFSQQQNRFIQLFSKEVFPLRQLPSLWGGSYIVRSTRKTVKSIQFLESQDFFRDHFTSTSSLPISCIPEYDSPFTKVFYKKVNDVTVFVAITNTFHSSTKGETIGEVLFVYCKSYVRPEVVEGLLDRSGYDILLMDSSIPHQKEKWQKDSSYWLYCYNLNPKRFFGQRPIFSL